MGDFLVVSRKWLVVSVGVRQMPHIIVPLLSTYGSPLITNINFYLSLQLRKWKQSVIIGVLW